MFCYQTQVAINKWNNPPVVDTTEIHNFADIDPPLITICSRDQWSESKVKEFGYDSPYYMLNGFDRLNNVTGWGAQNNMTFDEMITESINLDGDVPYVIMERETFGTIEYEKRFYPMFGWCADVANYTIDSFGSVHIMISVNRKDYEWDTAQIFLTDKKLRTMHKAYYQSHRGTKMYVKNGWDFDFMVEVRYLSNFDPRKPDNCKEFTDDEYSQCIDVELSRAWKEAIGCNPPWLSTRNQCSEPLNTSQEIIDSILNKVEPLLDGIFHMDIIQAKETCKPCSIMRPTVFINERKEGYYFTNIKINFEDLVIKRSKMLAYGFSEFLIDMGSSLGLWFGLSVFGITDLGVGAYQWIMKTRSSKATLFK
jgi:hypothetical protein